MNEYKKYSDVEKHFEKYAICRKDIPYDEKVEFFDEKVELFKDNIGQIKKSDFSKIYELLKNENLIITYLPIFKYHDKIMCMATGEINDDFEHGKYAILTANEINQFLEKEFLVFLYNLSNEKYNDNDELKYRTVILNKC